MEAFTSSKLQNTYCNKILKCYLLNWVYYLYSIYRVFGKYMA